MNTLLRKFTRTKWLVNKEKDLVNYSADAITGCIRTSGETLSVWVTSTKDLNIEHNKKIVAGLALGMTKPDAIDIIFFEKDEIQKLGLELSPTIGQTNIKTINEFHNDIVNINYEKLGVISEHIVYKLADDRNAIRISRNKLIEVVIEYIGKEYLFDSLSDKWKEAVVKKLGPDHPSYMKTL